MQHHYQRFEFYYHHLSDSLRPCPSQGHEFAVTVGSATANLLLTDTDTKILQNPRIRATDGQKAIMKIGSKIPIATGSYQTGAATAVVSSLVNTQFQYQDVGVNIEMTPTVHFDRDVTLKIKIEVTAQSGTVTISGVTEPIISQRTVDQVIRLREGEASILGGIQDKQDTASSTGIPGLSFDSRSEVHLRLQGSHYQRRRAGLLVVPHVVRSQSLEQVNLRRSIPAKALRSSCARSGTTGRIQPQNQLRNQLESGRNPGCSAAPAGQRAAQCGHGSRRKRYGRRPRGAEAVEPGR